MVRISAKIKTRTNELITDLKTRRMNVEHHAETHVDSLRYDARLAYLDGQLARSKALHQEANRLARVLHASRRRK